MSNRLRALQRRRVFAPLLCSGVAARGGGAAFSPLDLTPALWIDPSDTATMFQSNAGTTTVTDTSVCGYAGDKSGAAFHITSVADDTTRPTWVSAGGFPYLNATAASSQVLRRTSSLGLYASGAGFSAFIAVRGNPAVGAALASEASSAASPQFYRFLRALSATATTLSPQARNDANTVILADAAVTKANAFDNTDRVVGIIDDGAGNITPYLDGVAGTPVSYTRSGVLTVNNFSLFAAINDTGTASPFTGRCHGLVIVKRVITGTEIANTTTHLGAKQGRVL